MAASSNGRFRWDGRAWRVAGLWPIRRWGDRAADRALSAVADLESVGHAYDAARARTVAARALAIAWHSERAAAELARAAADFDSFGAIRYRAEAERELRKLGRTVYHRSAPGSGADGIAALTERELQLARLVVDRKTNPQIAAGPAR